MYNNELKKRRDKERVAAKRSQESLDQKEKRLRRNREYQASRKEIRNRTIQNEDLAHVDENKAVVQESGGETEHSLSSNESSAVLKMRRDKERIAAKRSQESLDQKEKRLRRNREYQVSRKEIRNMTIQNEDLAHVDENNAVVQENGGETEHSLLSNDSSAVLKRRRDKEQVAAKRNQESVDQKEQRLSKNRERITLTRNSTIPAAGQSEYLENQKLERLFEEKIKTMEFSVCSICRKRELGFMEKTKCASCNRNPEANTFTAMNNMDPGVVPEELKSLSALEELLIAKVHPVISVYRTKGQQMHYSGHVINFPQDVRTFSRVLPDIKSATNSIIVVKKRGEQSHAHTDFRVCGKRVRNALLWLKSNNQYYQDIEISEDALNSLPENGNLIQTLPEIETTREYTVSFGKDEDSVETTSVPHLPVQNQEKQINDVLQKDIPWPQIDSAPIDEFRTAGYIACAFPTLFPTGNADLRQGRLKKIGDSDYFKFLMLYCDGRFSKHPRFPFFAMNTTLRWNALNQGKVFVRKNLAGKTIDDLKGLLDANKNLTNQIMFYGSSIRGTKAYWFKLCGELMTMVDQLGTPTIFFTLSAADLHWPDLFRLLRPNCGDGEEISHKDRTKLMSDNPFIVASFFEKRGTYFIENIMKKKFNITDYWFRFEWQHRGSPHIHGVFWIKDSPNVDSLEHKSEEYRINVIKYFDELASTWNPNKLLPPTNVHPCQIRLESVGETERMDDYTRILNKVQRHTVCSEAYCLRKTKGTSKLECRFKFPIEEREVTELKMESNGSLRLLTKRNDDRLNIHNRFVTSLWRANTDFQPILSRQAVINYIAKYAAKSEPQSESYKEMISTIVQEGNSNDPARKAVQKLLIKTVAERDYSAQEVAHTLMGYPLYHCSRQFVTITLKEDGWVVLPKNTEMHITEENFVEKYKARPDCYSNETLYNFSRSYYKKGSKWIKRRQSAVVQVFPKLKLKAESTMEQREEYFRQKVLLYVSWRSEANIREQYDSWESAFNCNNLEVFTENLDLNLAEEDEFEEIDDDVEVIELEEFMVAARDGPNRELLGVGLGHREIDLNHDWNTSYAKYNVENIVTFLANAKKEEGEDDRLYEHPSVILTKEQNEVMVLLSEQVGKLKNNCNPSVRRTIIQGKGGSGKSTVIKAMTARLYQEFGSDSFKLMAPTGSAAVNIGGSTIHSALNIGISGEIQKLQGSQLRQFQVSMESVKFIIFDEYSMVGSRLLGKIDQRCREAKPDNAGEVFGGMCVYFLGDIKQLPPVMDRAPYSKGTVSGIGANGRIAYHSFEKCIVLGDSQRQAGNDEKQTRFRDMLDRLSKGESTEEDWAAMNSRCTSQIGNYSEHFANSMRLFPTNELTCEYNIRRLTGLNVPVARIHAKHNCSQAVKGSSDSAQGLSPDLYLSVGSRIMLRSNLWTRKGLVNGSVGTVEDIVFRPEESVPDSLPLALIIKWDNYTGPTLDGGLFPLTPVTRYWNDKGKSCSRNQFPVCLAWAITIHKSQGMTLEKAVIDIGEKEFSAGLTYVALSRLKSLAGIAIDPPFGFERLRSIGNSVQLKERLVEEIRLRGLRQ